MQLGCPIDAHQPQLGHLLCPHCEHDYLTRVRALNNQLRALTTIALRQARIGTKHHQPTTGFPPSPIDWNAQQLIDQTTQWLHDVATSINPLWKTIPQHQWRKLWTRLITNYTTLLTIPTAAGDYLDLRSLSQEIEQRLTPQPEKRTVGHCPGCNALIQAARGVKTMMCPQCGESLDLAKVREAYLDDAARSELGTATLDGLHITRTRSGAAEWLSETLGRRFTGKQVENWRRRGKLPSCRRLGGGYWEWKVGELLACAGGE